MKICFVAHFAFGAMTGGETGHVGGVERQTSMTAKWLAARGHEVSILTWDEGRPEILVVDGVRIIRMCGRDSGIPGFRFFHPRWSSLVRAMAEADADVYYQNCAEYVTGQVSLWCRARGRRFVFSIASTAECMKALPELRSVRERVLYRYGLHHADRVVSQTEHQRELLRTGFGVDSTVLPMPCPGPSDTEYSPPIHPAAGPFRVLWAGRIASEKRLEWLLDVAGRMPDVTFDVAGAPTDANCPYARDVLERAASLQNVTLHGKVSRDRMPGMYRSAHAFLSTSVFEGFPNTFLEAWSHGLPIVTTFDPDGLVGRLGLGFAGDRVEGLVEGLRRLRSDPDHWRACSGSARRHYRENHPVEVVMPRFERMFADVLNPGSGAAGESP